jgi:exodeoxyribonuclease VII small subunit
MKDSTSQDFQNSKPVEQLTYEEAFTELEYIVADLESDDHSGEQSLEKALALFERGQALANYCAGLLDQAEIKVQQISGEELIPFNPQT